MADFPTSSQQFAYNYSSPQSEQQLTPPTITQAETITPVMKLVLLTGSTQIKWIGTHVAATVDPVIPEHAIPVQPGYHELVLVPDSASTLLTTGNIQDAVVLTANLPNLLYYDPSIRKYRGIAGNIT